MTILTAHEMGHFLQARRYHVPATWPFFLPVPFPPFGTFGAVIQMDSRIPNLRALFDIGISGPLAGLIPTLIFLVVGVGLSTVSPSDPALLKEGILFGDPLLFQWVTHLFFGAEISGPDQILHLHPIGMAAWTGLFITSLNLIPLGQLDGGHVFYALLRRKAHFWTSAIYYGILAFIVLAGRWEWIVMVILLTLIGIHHPPTGNDAVPLGKIRTILGILTLAFILIGFTPNPISETEPPPKEKPKPLYSGKENAVPEWEPFGRDLAMNHPLDREGIK